MASETDRVIRALEGAVTEIMKKIPLDVAANAIESTPIDTGWARANWLVSIGDGGAVVPVGSREAVSAAPQNAGIAAVLTTYRFGIRSAEAVYVTNPVPYIGKLNDGHSKQAPAGFVQNAISKAVTQDLKALG